MLKNVVKSADIKSNDNLKESELPKVLILSSRKNTNQVKKFHLLVKIGIRKFLDDRNLNTLNIETELAINNRVVIENESLNLTSTKSNDFQIDKLSSTQKQHIEYIEYLESFDIIIVYLPLDMRAMFETAYLYACGKKVFIFFCDEIVKFNVMFLPPFNVYGKNGEIDDIPLMLKAAFAGCPDLEQKDK